MATPNLVTSLGRQRTEVLASYAIPSASATGYVASGTISAFGPLIGAQSTVLVPLTEVWHLEDIYAIGGAQYVDATVLVFVNSYLQNFQPTLSSINLSLLTRFGLGETIVVVPGATLATSISLLGTAPTQTGMTQVVKLKFVKEPYTG